MTGLSRFGAAAGVMLFSGACAAGAFARATIRLATTTSTENSGLLGALLPAFEENYGVEVHLIAVGTGRAIEHGENGDVDVVLVHAREAEEEFVREGFGVNRRDVMHNDFVILGPGGDPAGIRGMRDAPRAFEKIALTRSVFVSRGDDSGTHRKEKALWNEADVKPSGAWYLSVGQGMGPSLVMAHEKRAYTLVDRGTFIAFKGKVNLDALVEGDERLFNPYGVIAVNPARHPHANYIGAMTLIAWLTSTEGQAMIAGYERGGEQLFYPDAVQAGRSSRDESILVNGFWRALKFVFSGDARVYSAALVSLWVACTSTLIASAIGLPLGFLIAVKEFRGRRVVITVLNTLLALPTVVVGLFVYSFLRRGSFLGPLELLFSPAAMVMGQVVLGLPIVVALGQAAVSSVDRAAPEAAASLGAAPARVWLTTAWEARYGLTSAVAAAGGRLIGEVGVSMILGGNIAGYTRTLTTAIALETSRGRFAFAVALGLVLLAVALVVNFFLRYLQGRGEGRT